MADIADIADQIWAKWYGADEQPYPLALHLRDTAAVALALWDEVLSTPIRNRLAELLAAGNQGEARNRFATIAGLHDLGKADPLFQGQLKSPRASEYAPHLLKLAEYGLPIEFPEHARARRIDKEWRLYRHEAMTAHALTQLTSYPQWVQIVVSGHHGRFNDGIANLYDPPYLYHQQLLKSPWRHVIEHLIASVNALIPSDPSIEWMTDSQVKKDKNGSLIPVLTGYVVLCDWLASDEAFIAARRADPEPTDFAQIVNHAKEFVQHNMGIPARPTGSFSEVFSGFTPNRDVQKWAVENSHQPGLTIIMVPMGEGKTETAAWMYCAEPELGEGIRLLS